MRRAGLVSPEQSALSIPTGCVGTTILTVMLTTSIWFLCCVTSYGSHVMTHHSGLNAAQLWLQHQVLLLSNPAAVIAVLGCGRDQSVDDGLG